MDPISTTNLKDLLLASAAAAAAAAGLLQPDMHTLHVNLGPTWSC